MQFYRLTHPDYPTDRHFSKANPAQIVEENRLPGIDCDQCGRWSGSTHIRVNELIVQSISRYLLSIGSPRFVSPRQWETLIQDLSSLTGLPEETFWPGADYGDPVGVLQRDDIADFLHPFPGTIWITSEVVSAFRDAGLTGADYVPVKLKLPQEAALESPPQLWEIVVKGQAWRHGMDLDTVTVCRICRRKKFPKPEQLSIDLARWDGTDFFHVDLNPNIVLVTDGVSSVLEKAKFSNVRCIPI